MEIHENSSWSCAHGIERWRADCGCSTGGYPDWNQAWRAPLREAFDWLKRAFDPIYEKEASAYLKDPWAARDGYIEIINDRSAEKAEAFFASHARRPLGRNEKVKTLKLLEGQRNTQLMYTSCGWFFDEVSGIEGVQVMMYAARAIQLASEAAGAELETEFEGMLEGAPSNIYGNARNAYNMFVKVARVDLLRVGAHHAISSLFFDHNRKTEIYAFNALNESLERIEAGKNRLAIGRTVIGSKVTWEEAKLSTAVLHLGEVSINCGIKYFRGEDEFTRAKADLKAAFDRGEIPDVIRLMDKHFGTGSYSLWHLFKDQQRKIINEILLATYKDIEGFHRHIFESNYGTMDFLRKLGIPLPRPLGVSAEFILNHDLEEILKEKELDIDGLGATIKKSQHLSAQIDPDTIGYVAGAWINARMEETAEPCRLEDLERIRDVLRLLRATPVKLNLWKSQNIYYQLGRKVYPGVKAKAGEGDDGSRKWVAVFDDLGSYFHMKVSG